jgi:hypothetical protein
VRTLRPAHPGRQAALPDPSWRLGVLVVPLMAATEPIPRDLHQALKDLRRGGLDPTVIDIRPNQPRGGRRRLPSF